MIKIKIMTEFLHSPIWTYEDGIVTDDLPLVLEDKELQVLSEKIRSRKAADFRRNDPPLVFEYSPRHRTFAQPRRRNRRGHIPAQHV